MNNYNNPYAQYKQTAVETASPSRLLIMMFDGAIKFLNQSIDALENKDMENSNLYLQKTQDIVQELMVSLDMNIEISHNLFNLYSYFYKRLIEANLKKDKAIIEEVLQFLKELRETWFQAINTANNATKVHDGLNIEG